MASWFNRIPKLIQGDKSRISVPPGVWTKCLKCSVILYSKDLEANYKVCPNCNFHFRLTVEERINYIVDEGTFEEFDANITSVDILKFVDSKKYKDRLKIAVNKTKSKEALCSGHGKIHGKRIVFSVFNFKFMGGSMGSVVGEKITRAIEFSIQQRLPLLIVSASGGARMQEGTYSLMQMAKTAVALRKLSKSRLPYISLLTDPTTGGVSASFAMLGDLILVEPGALVGFAGPRVIQQTIGEELPEGFQKAEFLLEKGAVDMIVARKDLKEKLYQLFMYLNPTETLEALPAPT